MSLRDEVKSLNEEVRSLRFHINTHSHVTSSCGDKTLSTQVEQLKKELGKLRQHYCCGRRGHNFGLITHNSAEGGQDAGALFRCIQCGYEYYVDEPNFTLAEQKIVNATFGSKEGRDGDE